MKNQNLIRTQCVPLWLAVGMVVGLSSCAPEQTSEIYPKELVGLEPVREWSNSTWLIQLPENWIAEPVFGMRDASFRVVGANGNEADISISRLPIQGGTLASNVNRWRTQAGLESWKDDEVQSLLTPINISNQPAYRMEFPAAETDSQSIYGIIMETEAERIFIKFAGPAELMESQLEAWNYFVDNLEMRHAH